MEQRKVCIFACGGHGTRMGGDIPKQFLRLGDKTILQLSIERVNEALGSVKSIVVLPQEWMGWWKEECARTGFDLQQSLVKGGITRFHSVRNALDKVPSGCIVGVHDGVRPCCSAALIARLFDEAQRYPAVVPVTPVTDTLKVLSRNPDGELETIQGASADRSVLFGAQTPQVFRSEVLVKAYSQAYGTAFTDDASVVEASGCRIRYVEGERNNLKITTREDLPLAAFILGL